MNFDLKFTEACSQVSNWQQASIGSDNGLVPNRCQVIICPNHGLVYWRIYASAGTYYTMHVRSLRLCHTVTIPSPGTQRLDSCSQEAQTPGHTDRQWDRPLVEPHLVLGGISQQSSGGKFKCLGDMCLLFINKQILRVRRCTQTRTHTRTTGETSRGRDRGKGRGNYNKISIHQIEHGIYRDGGQLLSRPMYLVFKHFVLQFGIGTSV